MAKVVQDDKTQKSTISISSDIQDVQNENYYHGLLPREDLPHLLAQVGDFLVRITQPKPGAQREFVISLRVSKEDIPLAIRHILLHKRKGPDGKYEWRAIEPQKFNSIKELIDAYVANKKPINPEVKTSQLRRSIARKSWELLHEQIKVNELIGEGQFGEVRAGEALIDGKKIPVAIKIAKTPKDSKQQERIKQKVKEMMHEARLMRYFNHKNVVKIHGVAVLHEPLMIIIEMVNGGSLSDVLEFRKGKVDEIEKIENMSLGSARGLKYIHAHKVIHRDIAARNVLYTEKRVAKISDFGMSREGEIYEMARGNRKVPLKWTAPETMVTFLYTPKTDVFSYSILLWEIFSDGDEPYKGKTNIEVKRMVACGQRMERPNKCPDPMYHIMEKCWEQDPNKRFTMAQVVDQIEDILDRFYSEDTPPTTTTTAETVTKSPEKRLRNSQEERTNSKRRRRRKGRRKKSRRRALRLKTQGTEEERKVTKTQSRDRKKSTA